MKKIILSLIALAIAVPSFAQTQWTTSGTNIYNSNTGNVGIGTTSPNRELVISNTNADGLELQPNQGTGLANLISYNRNTSTYKDFKISASNIIFGWGSSESNEAMRVSSLGNVGIGTISPSGKLQIDQLYNIATPALNLNQPYTSWGTLAFFNSYRYFQTNSGATDGNFKAFNIGAGGVSIGYSSTPVYNSGDALYINGNVGIGTPTPKEALSVNGNIRSKQIKVETANWPDYVFKKDYSLPSLSEIKTYIDQNQHLPEMPSEAEVAKDGINLGEMVKLQTKKIEELTLYLIEKDKRDNEKDAKLQSQQIQIEDQKKAIQSLQEQMDRLAKKSNN